MTPQKLELIRKINERLLKSAKEEQARLHLSLADVRSQRDAIASSDQKYLLHIAEQRLEGLLEKDRQLKEKIVFLEKNPDAQIDPDLLLNMRVNDLIKMKNELS